MLDYNLLEGRLFTIAYTKWLLAMHVYVGVHYGDIKRVFDEKNPRYPTPPQVDTQNLYRVVDGNPLLTEQVYDNEVHNEILKRRIIISETLREEYCIQPGKVYTLVWGQLGQSTKDLVKSCTEYTDLKEHENDPFALVALIKRVHASRGVADNEQVRRAEAQKQYNRIYQDQGESLTKYKERFNAAVAELRDSGAKVPEEGDLAHTFVERINRKVFGDSYNYYTDLFQDLRQ